LERRKLGFIVNPIAGMGGKVGLKGTDSYEILRKARELGATPASPQRAVRALERMTPIREGIDLVTYPYEMGENEAREAGFNPTVLGSIQRENTTSDDTKNAAKEMLRLRVDLLLFAGGDGTARDIYDVIGERIPLLGVPTGVKIHSAVYATSPQNAGDLASMYLEKEMSGTRLREAEVMDIDEKAFRENRLSARLYGYAKVPYERRLIQGAKAGSAPGEDAAVEAVSSDFVNNMEDDWLYIIGPGTTTKSIMERLGLKNTLLGIDAVYNKKLVGSDLNEAQLLRLTDRRKAKIAVTIIGGQGYIFGRGNQQISAEVITRVGSENIIVVTTMNKILSLRGNPLLVDTGDDELNKELTGYRMVVTGLNQRAMLRVAC
jgi:predicted polyphosphate/ATP-dependent NAD kinase